MFSGAEAAGAQEAAPATAPTSSETASAEVGRLAQVYEPAFFARFAPKSALDMVGNIPGFDISRSEGERGFGQASQNVLINGRRVSGKSNDATTALQRIAADTVLRIEIVDGATLNIPGLSGQVANVIAATDALSGSWHVQPELRENLQPSWYNGSLSANGKTGGWSWSAAVNAREFHNGHDGPTLVTNAAGVVTDVRREGFHGAGEEPDLNATVTYETLAGSIANVNLSLRSFNFVGREDSFRNPAAGAPESRFAFIGEDEIGGEIGADLEFDLGPGRLKLIALQSYEDEDEGVTLERYGAAGQALSGERVQVAGEEGESIGRAEYGFRAFGGDLQLAAEGAFNFIDVATELAEREPDGSYLSVPLPDGTARVEERRAETNISYSRKLSDAWSLQSSLGGEYSELTQTGAAGQTREFVRPKGFLSLVWKASDTLDVSLKGERKVGQLDFGDFLSSVNLQNDLVSGGNADLVPQQSWIASTEINRKLGKWGAVKLSLAAEAIEDVVDQKLIITPGNPGGVSGVGNIGKASAWSAQLSGTINFDPLGFKGLQLTFNSRWEDSAVDDPLTGISREISRSDKFVGDASVRWDVPDTQWTLGAGIEEYQGTPGYRLDQIGRNWTAPSTNFFWIENKDVFGMKVRLMAVNLNDTSENARREVYLPGPNPGDPRLRTNGLDFTEEGHRTFGPIVRLRVSGTF